METTVHRDHSGHLGRRRPCHQAGPRGADLHPRLHAGGVGADLEPARLQPGDHPGSLVHLRGQGRLPAVWGCG
eukprot:7843057-Pyramimonas_sp.AAC.1